MRLWLRRCGDGCREVLGRCGGRRTGSKAATAESAAAGVPPIVLSRPRLRGRRGAARGGGPRRIRALRDRGEGDINVLPCPVTMSSTLAHAPAPKVRVRPAERGDVDALAALEHRVFATDRLSRRSLQRFLKSPAADVLVAQDESGLVGNAIVLFRPRSLIARLYSIAVAPD